MRKRLEVFRETLMDLQFTGKYSYQNRNTLLNGSYISRISFANVGKTSNNFEMAVLTLF